MWRIEIRDKAGIFDAVGEGIRKDILDLGMHTVRTVRFSPVYTLEPDLPEEQVRLIASRLLVDPICQEFFLFPPSSVSRLPSLKEHIIEVAYNPGVMDPVEESTLKGIRDLGVTGAASVRTSKKYHIDGDLTADQLKTISEKLLYNKLIQHVVGPQAECPQTPRSIGYKFRLITVDVLNASDKKLKEISGKGQLFLNLPEMRAIQQYFKKLGRNPTDCELETLAQTWSEHCWHKTFRGKIDYTEKLATGHSPLVTKHKRINNLLKSTIMKATVELNKPWCVSVFHDNSGVIRFDKDYNVCFKVETHNHPSALEPFGGANTGIGGVIRDPLGTGLGAKPILNTDVFCFGPPDYPFKDLPHGSLHPKRVAKGVVSGVRDYGNKMGIPTVNGAVLFHERFIGNPLVYCGTVGILPKNKSFKKTSAGDYIVVTGGRTGRDGIHGATFSSGELTHESETISGGAVQIGNPIQEKKMLDVILQARDMGLYSAITDCGAGGLSSAVGEMGSELGARVDLEKVPLKYTGLSYTEIWISESQERMVLSVPPKKAERLRALFESENVEATVIGEFVETGKLELFYEGTRVCELGMDFLHNGIPRLARKAVYIQKKHTEHAGACPRDLTEALVKILSNYDVCSKEWIIRQYDHEVQGGSVLKPLVGKDNDGPSDASVVRPVLGSQKGLVVACGINFRFGMCDPYWMAASCIDEALRQIIAVGGSLKQVAILDNFCWGNPDKPDRLGSLVRAAYGCYYAAKAYGVPFISGKDSLYNEFTVRGESISIPGTLLISALGIFDDVRTAVSMYAKQAGHLVYAVGLTRQELGGSQYLNLHGLTGNAVPRIYPHEALAVFSGLSRAAAQGLVAAMHDCSEGGIAVAAAEMAFAGGLGMELFVNEISHCSDGRRKTEDGRSNKRNDYLLFSESNSRFVVEVSKENQKKFEQCLRKAGAAFGLIGCVGQKKDFRIYGIDGTACVTSDIDSLKKAWREPLSW